MIWHYKQFKNSKIVFLSYYSGSSVIKVAYLSNEDWTRDGCQARYFTILSFCRGTLNCNTRFLVMDIVHVPKLVPCEHVSYVGRLFFVVE